MKKTLLLFFSTASLVMVSHAQLIVSTGSLSAARVGHQSQMLNNGKVVAFGGCNGNVSSLVVYNSAQIYDPASGTWSNTGSMSEARNFPASALLSNGNILVIGGEDVNSVEKSTCEIYNATSGTWSSAGNLNTARSLSSAIVLNNSKILVIGGTGTSTCELYDQSSGTWALTGSLNVIRSGRCTACKMADGRVLVAGGNNDNTAEIYDPSTGVWTNVVNTMTTGRTSCTSILMTNNKVLVAGGNGTSAEVFDPSSSTFTATGAMLHGTTDCGMVNLTNGKVLIYGLGDLFSTTDREALQVYSPSANGWYLAGPVPISVFPAQSYTIHTLQNGKILIVAGNFSTGNGANQYCYLVNQSSVAAGIDNHESNPGISIYPNPVEDLLVIKCNTTFAGKLTMNVTDVTGRDIIEAVEIPGTTGVLSPQLDVSILPSGVYFLRIIDESGITSTIKFMKK